MVQAWSPVLLEFYSNSVRIFGHYQQPLEKIYYNMKIFALNMGHKVVCFLGRLAIALSILEGSLVKYCVPDLT